MNDQEINVAIAEACGMRLGVLWCEMCQRFCGPEEVTSNGMHDTYEGGCGMRVGSRSVPDYCNDLTAMHEVEALKASDMLWCQNYQEHLRFTCDKQVFDWETCFIWHATARQRAEAFLRTIGNWVD